MSEFQPINTQEEFNAAISERINRERAKYADYDDLKNKVTTHENTIAELQRQANENAQKYAGYDNDLADRDAKIKAYETASVKTRIAHETGIPFEMASRLSGETEDEIRADAKTMAALFGNGVKQSPGKSAEKGGAGKAGEDAALAAFAKQITNKE